MNKCILFSLGLAGAGAWNKEKMNLKQMVKSNKQSRRRVQAERNENTGCLFTRVSQNPAKLTGRENTKACVLIFCLRAPPGLLKHA